MEKIFKLFSLYAIVILFLLIIFVIVKSRYFKENFTKKLKRSKNKNKKKGKRRTGKKSRFSSFGKSLSKSSRKRNTTNKNNKQKVNYASNVKKTTTSKSFLSDILKQQIKKNTDNNKLAIQKKILEEKNKKSIQQEKSKLKNEANLREQCQNSDLHVQIYIKPKQTSSGYGTIDYFFTKNDNDERMTDNTMINTRLVNENTNDLGGWKTPEKNDLCKGNIIQKLIISVQDNIEYSLLKITLQSNVEQMTLSYENGTLRDGENIFDLGDFTMTTSS